MKVDTCRGSLGRNVTGSVECLWFQSFDHATAAIPRGLPLWEHGDIILVMFQYIRRYAYNADAHRIARGTLDLISCNVFCGRRRLVPGAHVLA